MNLVRNDKPSPTECAKADFRRYAEEAQLHGGLCDQCGYTLSEPKDVAPEEDHHVSRGER